MQPDCSKLLKILKTFCMAQTIKTTFELKDIKTFDFQRCVLQKLEFQVTEASFLTQTLDTKYTKCINSMNGGKE